MMKWKLLNSIVLAGSLLLGACQAGGDGLDAGDRAVAEAAAADQLAADSIQVTVNYPDPSFLRGPAEIDAWVNHVNASMEKYEQKGPYTIARTDGNYEVTAFLAEGEIIMLHCFAPGGRGQQWYYLNNYLVPTLREVGRNAGGRYFERRFYYAGTDRRLAARERLADEMDQLLYAPWRRYRESASDDFRLNPEAVRRSALDFVAGN